MQTSPRRRPVLRRALAASALVVAAPLVASCGFDVQTDAVYQPAEGANARAEGTDVLGAVVVSDTKGTGRVVATLVNKRNSSDELTGVSGSKVKISGPESLEVPSNAVGFTNLADAKFTPIVATGSTIDAGGYVTLRFTFTKSSPVTVDAPVVDTQGTYSGLAPGQSAASGSSSAGDTVAAQGSQGAFTSRSGAAQ